MCGCLADGQYSSPHRVAAFSLASDSRSLPIHLFIIPKMDLYKICIVYLYVIEICECDVL